MPALPHPLRLRVRVVNPDVARPLNRAAAAAIASVSSAVGAVRFVAEAAEAWLEQHGEIFDARADVDDPDLVDELEDDE